MPRLRAIAVLLLLSAPAFAEPVIPIDCSRGQSLQNAVALAFPNITFAVRGACTGPLLIRTDGLSITAYGAASISGNGHNAVTVDGAKRVVLSGLTITGGVSGVLAENTAQVTLKNDAVQANAQSGILIQSGSSATVSGGTATGNGLHGIDVESTSSLTVTGSYTITGNAVFGIDVNNGSSLTLTAANLLVSSNVLGVQLGTNASGFLDGQSVLNTSNNFTVGLTMVSGAHMVDFGGAITSSGNGINGISLNSKAGLDMDAASQVQSNNNGVDGVHLEQLSVMTVFNNPLFSGASGTTTLIAQGNQGDGINLLTNSEMLVDNYASLQITGNKQAGVSLDDGSSLSFGQTVPVTGVQSTVSGNNPDLSLTFASRLTTLANDSLGTVRCDATALVRGPLAITCPK